jgi:2-polyprenyl-3-methyl-5-hydroxy-6-metoxy-1,4-benzoquinol methylase
MTEYKESTRSKKFSKKNGKTNKLVSYSDKLFSNYFWRITDTIANKNWKIAEIYEKAIGEKYKIEYEKFGILKSEKILHIGCGYYPLTEIILANSSIKKIVGIDKNIGAVKSAREVINKKNLNGRISIKHGNGIDFRVDGFNVIIISSCSVPKEDILKNIFNNSSKNCLIVVREINTAINEIFNNIENSDDIEFIDRLKFKSKFLFSFTWNSILLAKSK